MSPAIPAISLVGAFALLLVLNGCEEQKNEYVAPPPPKVSVAHPERRDFVESFEYTGSLAAVESVDLVARVEGFLQSIHFKDGELVDQGQLLFVIDPKPFEADLQRAKAQVEVHKAEVITSETEYERNRKLRTRGAASDSDVVMWKGSMEKAKGEVASAEAQVALANINLGYTHIYAPFRGLMSRRQVDIGNLVGGDEDTVLATITRNDPIYVYFSLSEHDVLRIRAIIKEEYPEHDNSAGRLYQQVEVPLRVALGNEDDYPHEGTVDYVDPTVDPATGTLTARGIFSNPALDLTPGMFVRVKLGLGKPKPVLMVPERALGVAQGGRYVLVVNDNDEVEARPVELGAQIGSMYVVEDGVSEQDRIVVNGIQMARPGAIVNPELVELSSPDKPPSESEKSARTEAEPSGDS